MENDEEPFIRLKPLIYPPTEEELAAVIYQVRWVDGIKNGELVSDKEIAKAILKTITK